MKKIIDLSAQDAKKHFLKGSSYFRNDFPSYINFEPILEGVATIMGDNTYPNFLASVEVPETGKSKPLRPANFADVNYNFTANKDGRLGWRPFELVHPAIYVSLVNVMCEEENWAEIVARFHELAGGAVECCSAPVLSTDIQSDTAAQVKGWWLDYEQKAIELSLEYTHIIQTDVSDCYGSIYTHSIAWALHGLEESKLKKGSKSLLGNKIDRHIQESRYGQTNGIVQGSVLMDIIAELVLIYVDSEINATLEDTSDIRILRYRDDYRIFSMSDRRGEEVLKVISDCLRAVGMRLGSEKTSTSNNIVEASVKEDKRAGIELLNMDITQAKSLQKQLLRLHAFSLRYPNSGALKRLSAETLNRMEKITKKPDDLKVQIAIVADIAATSPQAFPALVGILSHLISHAEETDKQPYWNLVLQKMRRVPYNGYLEIWLQRLIKPLGIAFQSEEAICKIVNGGAATLWNNDWLGNDDLKSALSVSKIVSGKPEDATETMSHDEVKLFIENAEFS